MISPEFSNENKTTLFFDKERVKTLGSLYRSALAKTGLVNFNYEYKDSKVIRKTEFLDYLVISRKVGKKTERRYYKRINKDNGAIILFAQTPFDKALGASNLPMLKYEWVWRKSRPTGHLNANKMPMKAHENILVFYKKPPTFNKQMTIGKPNHVKDGSIRKSKATNNNYGHFENVVQKATELKNPVTVIEFSQQDPNKIEHPTQKPLDLMEYLVKTYTNEGDMVLDNTMGSGTTNLACIKLNRKSIGIEKEKQYYDVAVRRASEYCH
jgi:site-specific DNA-methyltransferase (adenine-specific)